MWTYLTDDARKRETGVCDEAMERLKAPEPTRRVSFMGDLDLRQASTRRPLRSSLMSSLSPTLAR